MTISAYVGLPGSGKSYGVVENVILPALKKGVEVWTNIPMNLDILEHEIGTVPTQFNTADILDNDNWFQDVLPKGVLFVLDEVWQIWPAGLKANNAKDGHKSFLAEHRHLVSEKGKSTEIVLVTQDLSQIAAFSRALVSYTYLSVKHDALGANKHYRIDIYQGPVTGQSPPKGKQLRQIHGKYKPEIYKFYKSHTKSETGTAGDESRSDNRQNILKGTLITIVAGLALSAIVVYFGISAVAGYYGLKDEPEQTPEKEQAISRDAPGMLKTQTPVKQQPVKPAVYDALEGTKHYISFNNQNGQYIDYRIAIKKKDGQYTLTGKDIVNLGYKMKQVNQCLLIITVETKVYPITCPGDGSDGLKFDWAIKSEEA